MTCSTASFDDVHAWASESLAAGTGAQAQALDARIAEALAAFFAPHDRVAAPARADRAREDPATDEALARHAGDDASALRADGDCLARLFTSAPSADTYRHLWRILARSERDGKLGGASVVRLFAIPVVVVAALEPGATKARELPGVAADVAALTALLVEHGALAGNRTVALSPALVDATAVDLARLPSLLATAALEAPAGAAASSAAHSVSRLSAQPDLVPAPIAVTGPMESVHLRFLVGTALAAPGADLFGRGEAGRWAMPFAQRLGAALAAPGVVVLPMPRAPQPLVEALWHGRMAQREVSAQLFASNALRDLRARVGEPVAVISVHRGSAGDAPAEVRLSISSPLEPRDAQGLRCPLWPLDRPDDVVAMLATLLADCRVSDVRRMSGVHPDRDPVTGGPLLFKAETARAGPTSDAAACH